MLTHFTKKADKNDIKVKTLFYFFFFMADLKIQGDAIDIVLNTVTSTIRIR